MKKLFLKHLAAIAAFMGFDPDAKEPLDFSAEKMEKLNKAIGYASKEGEESFAEAFVAYYNNEYIGAASKDFDTLKAELAALDIKPAPSAGTDVDDEPAAEVPTTDDKSVLATLQAAISQLKVAKKTNEQQAADLAKLKDEPEPDVPEAVIDFNPNNTKAVKHSATHLFASGQSYDSVEARPWNKNLIDALNQGVMPKGATDWNNKVNIDKINEDLGAYSRRNGSEIFSLFMDGYDLPAHWSIVSNIQDQYVFASIVTGEITQALKTEFLPKNNQRFVPVINKIYDKQIDVFFTITQMKQLEKSWMNQFFNEGSTPFKMGFAKYLLNEIFKQVRKEDKISLFKGVKSDPTLQPGKAGSFINAMSGLLKFIDTHRDKTYKAFDTPVLTPANTYSVLTQVCQEQLPLDFRSTPGLKLSLGKEVHRWYVDGREAEKGTIQDYKKDSQHIEGMTNIEFDIRPQLEGTGFFYLTTDNNLGIMVDKIGEDSSLKLGEDLERRGIIGVGDYKLGPFVKAFGANVDPDAEVTYENQIFFSNNVPLLTDTYVPIAVNDVTPSLAEHHALRIGGNNTSAQTITNFDDATDVSYVYLYCDDATNAPTIANNANIILATGANFTMAKGDKLILSHSNGKFIEYSRTVAAEVSLETKVTLAADATTADAANGTWFVTQDNTAPTAITNIANAVVDEEYTIEGGSATNSTTIASGGNFLLSATFTASVGARLTVKYNGSKFVEVSR
ncbi:hypothetical protein [Thalassobellus citreus]|uniref:hypothetical protein n=1 Tax=Thalassobellus citreus TaxID=3367752 RepID=UPI00378E18B9